MGNPIFSHDAEGKLINKFHTNECLSLINSRVGATEAKQRSGCSLSRIAFHLDACRVGGVAES